MGDKMEEIPLGLKHALEAGECVLFIGAGIGDHLKDSNNNPAPNGPTLAKELADNFSIDSGGKYKLAKISKIVELRKGRPELLAFLRKRLSGLTPDSIFLWLCSLRWKAIYTTNYDRSIQRAYDLTKDPPQNPKTITATSEIVPFDERFDVPIYHLHGALFESESPQIIITEDDYVSFKERRRMLFELLKKEFITSTILYIGYSNQDNNWKYVLEEISSEFFPSKMPVSYRVDPFTDSLDKEILENKNINTLLISFEEFVSICSASISPSDKKKEIYEKIQSKIPSDLLEVFTKNPVAVTRLLSSWTYVNQAPFNESPNSEAFLKGDKPNWALIGSKNYFERDLEEDLYEDLLDYATSSGKSAFTRILLAPAGYGITTLMMALAVKIVKEKAGPVFMLKAGCQLLEGDIEFAASIFKERPFFFIDNAADNVTNLRTSIQRFKDTKTTGMFFLGERLNEFRQSIERLSGKEFIIDPLSDPEINRLLDYLGINLALNKLEHLSRDLQFSAIKKNYNKELLVAMKEATEGKEFDAIIEDEYRGISGELSRSLYLIVCCFYQHGIYIRDSLLADLLGRSLVDLHKETSTQTEGVVIYDVLDESKGIYGVRARHRTIASVVWERCGMFEEKEGIIQHALDSLNLNYSLDARAFESFYRSDRLVDTIRDLDGKMNFFEKACKKDPESPYVRQHYARMLTRENKHELALNQIDIAIQLDNRVRILYHTKGMILSKMVSELPSIDLARKRLIQSESNFNKSMNMGPKNSYCYQGLAQLYVEWAKKCGSDSEATDYIAKAEGIINEGLRMVRIRDSLWIESANIQRFLGDNPGYIKFLERAIQDRPTSIIARYLLGRIYRKEEKYDSAVNILTPVVQNHHDEFRSFVEYALSIYRLGKPLKECIAVLQQSTLYGYNDPRFITTLGGMLFLDGSFSESEKVFQESSNRNFTASEVNSIQFRPCDPLNLSDPLRLKGYVVIVKSGYALIESEGYPKPFLCPGSKFKGTLMEKGLNLTFQIVFNAKGPLADNPKV